MSTLVGAVEVALGDICEFRYGKALPEGARNPGPHPVYRSNGVIGSHSEAITHGATMIIGRKGSFGEIKFSPVPCWPIDTTYYVDASCTSVDLRWLTHRLAALNLKELNRAAAVPGLNRADAYSQRLLLPSPVDQRRVAAILDRADNLRAKRRQAVALLDALVQSSFVDLFGDPVANPCRWPVGPSLGDVADIVSGITKGRKVNGSPTREVSYLAVANVQDRHLDMRHVKTIAATESEIERYRLKRGDLLLTEGGDPDKLGRGTLWADEIGECIHQNHIFRVRLTDGRFTPTYLNWLVGSARGRLYFLRSAKQTTGIASINLTQLRGFPLLRPPLELQSEFGRLLSAVQDLRAKVLEAEVANEALFASLRHRAFRGEL